MLRKTEPLRLNHKSAKLQGAGPHSATGRSSRGPPPSLPTLRRVIVDGQIVTMSAFWYVLIAEGVITLDMGPERLYMGSAPLFSATGWPLTGRDKWTLPCDQSCQTGDTWTAPRRFHFVVIFCVDHRMPVVAMPGWGRAEEGRGRSKS